jgi:hypothetical protein
VVRGALSLLHAATREPPEAVAATNGRRPVGELPPRRRSRPELWATFREELDRSRRYGRPFALVSLSAETDEALEIVSGLVRGVDRVWADEDRVALLPESTRARASSLVERIRAAAPALVADVRCVGFPEDAMTGAALLAAARAPGEEAFDPGELAPHAELAPLRAS